MALVDVVVVSFNSREHLRACLEPLAGVEWTHVVVVDNASGDGSLESVADLPVETIQMGFNTGFATASNRGFRSGTSPYVLFLNPDASLGPDELLALLEALEQEPETGLVAPRIRDEEGTLHFSVRRFPRLRSTYAQALFLHRLFQSAGWTDEVVRDSAAYVADGSPEWLSGACLLGRRDLLEQLDGFDERFFLYCEDMDLCRRVRDAGFDVRFLASVEARHVGGASAPRSTTLPLLAESRVRYAQLHGTRLSALLERLGIALGGATHMLLARGGRRVRYAHVEALRIALGGTRRSAR